MSVIVILILVSLSIAGTFLFCFVWAVRSGQYEDTETPSMRILMEPLRQQSEPKTISKNNQSE
jgi:cbb3-type cytochrome oxidase maturation protein